MSVVAGRYARALADAIFDQKLDALKTAAALRELKELLDSSHELRVVWENPSVSHEQKHGVLDAIVQKTKLPKLLRNFMAVLIDHRRVGQLGEIVREFEAEINDRLGLAEAEITTARELGANERKRLEKKIAEVVGKTIKANYATDAKVLGGAVVRVGSTIYDGSVRGQLQKLKEALSS
ncbi:MAG TPA: ATP synthase F1 subunit delta [Terriglobales bacterium]|jgi:F-type H+-transporting ATPase subunit delta|nr:ATP synthase F1 subunit delta [Terriglobales bacterium]